MHSIPFTSVRLLWLYIVCMDILMCVYGEYDMIR